MQYSLVPRGARPLPPVQPRGPPESVVFTAQAQCLARITWYLPHRSQKAQCLAQITLHLPHRSHKGLLKARYLSHRGHYRLQKAPIHYTGVTVGT